MNNLQGAAHRFPSPVEGQPVNRKRGPGNDFTATELASTGKKARSAHPVETPPDVLLLQEFVASTHVLQAPGIEEMVAPHCLPPDVRVLNDVHTDDPVSIIKVRDNEALGTSGVATCYAVCARGVDSEGVTTLAMKHVSSITRSRKVIEQIRNGMLMEGVHDYDLFIVGGRLSIQVKTSDPSISVSGTLEQGMELISLAGDCVLAARIGLSESEEDDLDPDTDCRLMETTGRPGAVSVVITKSGIYYAREDEELFHADKADCEEVNRAAVARAAAYKKAFGKAYDGEASDSEASDSEASDSEASDSEASDSEAFASEAFAIPPSIHGPGDTSASWSSYAAGDEFAPLSNMSAFPGLEELDGDR